MVDNLPPKADQRRRFKLAVPRRLSLAEIAVFLLVLNLFAIAGVLWRVETNKPPVIATVGVTQLSRMYSQQFASDSSNTPEIIAIKTRLFVATTEKLIGQTAKQKGMVVFARECVLAGDHIDLTPEIATSVDQALKAGQLAGTEVRDGPLKIAP